VIYDFTIHFVLSVLMNISCFIFKCIVFVLYMFVLVYGIAVHLAMIGWQAGRNRC